MFDQAFTGNAMFPLGIKHKSYLGFIMRSQGRGGRLVTNNTLVDVCSSNQHTKKIRNSVTAL